MTKSKRPRILLAKEEAYAARPTHDPNGLVLTGPLPTRLDGTFWPTAPRIPDDGYFVLDCPGCRMASGAVHVMDTRDAATVRWSEDGNFATFTGLRCPACRLSWTVTAERAEEPHPRDDARSSIALLQQ